jgi:pentatricopeptide repeat protein
LALSILADAFFRKGWFDMAEQVYLDMANQRAADPRPLVAAAMIYLRRGNYDYADKKSTVRPALSTARSN